MAAVQFTTIPYEPNKANKQAENHIFGEINLKFL